MTRHDYKIKKKKHQYLDRLLHLKLHFQSFCTKHTKKWTSQKNGALKICNCYHIVILGICYLSGTPSSHYFPPTSFSPTLLPPNSFYNQAFTGLEKNCLLFIILNKPLSQRTNEPRAPSCVLPWNLKERFHRMHVKEGRVSIPQFNSCDPQGPDVTASVIGRIILLLTSNDLSGKSRTQHIKPTDTSEAWKGPWAILAPFSVPLATQILNPNNNKMFIF